ncbi:hypothetical protein BBH56_03445 [Spiribacter roseus]|nr:hypothetical protein BBH56_03445 [Spiribacter roseus]
MFLALALLLILNANAFAQTPSSWPSSQALSAFSGEVSDLVGIWAGDCSQPNGGGYVEIINRTHILAVSQTDSATDVTFDRLEDSWLNHSEDSYRVDGGLLYYQSADVPEEQAVAEKCRALPTSTSLLHGETTTLLLAMPAVQAACEQSTTICANELIAAGDMADTGGLNGADLSRLIRIATYLGTAEGSADGDQILGGQAISLGLAPAIADLVLRSFDYDADRQLSLEEITADGRLLGAGSLSVTDSSSDQLQESLEEGMQRLEGLLRMLQ